MRSALKPYICRFSNVTVKFCRIEEIRDNHPVGCAPLVCENEEDDENGEDDESGEDDEGAVTPPPARCGTGVYPSGRNTVPFTSLLFNTVGAKTYK